MLLSAPPGNEAQDKLKTLDQQEIEQRLPQEQQQLRSLEDHVEPTEPARKLEYDNDTERRSEVTQNGNTSQAPIMYATEVENSMDLSTWSAWGHDGSDWVAYTSEGGHIYYYNQVTGVSSWDRPDGVTAPPNC